MNNKPKRVRVILVCMCLVSLLVEQLAWADVSPAAVGWGNLVVPGLGATLRGQPVRGLIESSATIGSYYGGTFYAKEGAFTIDGSVLVPSGRNITKPLLGQFLQEFGLKFHMWNTFYNYQQASLEPSQVQHQKEYQQPLYKGDWMDVLFAPFKWKNISTPWTYIPVALGTAYLLYSYNTSPVVVQNHRARLGEEGLYDFTQGIGVPLGSSFGEEVLFRGFIQREARLYTNSVALSILWETTMFMVIHPPDKRPVALLGGVFFGLAVNHFDGDLEPGIASHFWIDFISGFFVTLLFRKVEGKGVPFSTSLQIPF